ncbi:hypothetical protein ABPG72_005704 [Tetrahymena utriculariae]
MCFNCQPGTYIDSQTMSCQICNQKCKTCFGGLETQCIQCAKPSQFFDQDNYCVDSCEAGYIKNPNTNKCQQCLYFSANFEKSICVLECPEQFYADSNNICQSCGSNCKHCLNQFTCIECNKNYSFKSQISKECSMCKEDQYKDDYNVCQKCEILNCKTCQNKSICQTCAIGYINKQTYCEYDQRYDNYSCSYTTQEQCQQELNLVTKADVSMQSVQITSFGVQSANTILFAQGTQFVYSLQIQQMIGNMKFTDKFKTLSIGSTFIDLNYQMNILSIIPNPIKSLNSQNSNQNKTSNYLQSQRILEENASSSELRKIESINLTNLFLGDSLIYLFITGIFIIILAICKLLSKKFVFFSEIEEKKYSFVIKLQLLFSNYLLISIFKCFKCLDFSTTLQIVSFVLQIVYMVCYALFLIFFYLQIKKFDKKSNMALINKYYILIDNINIDIPFGKYFWLFFEIRKILNIAFTFLVPSVILSLALVMSLNLIFFIYMIYYKPIISLSEQRYYYVLEFLQIAINLNIILLSSFDDVKFAWSSVINIGTLFVVIFLYSIYVFYKILKIKFCKKRFIVSKNQYYEEDVRQKQIKSIIDKNQMRIKVRSGILNQLENSLSYTLNSESNSSRIEYMDNIHQLSIKWNKNPIYTRNLALSCHKKQ